MLEWTSLPGRSLHLDQIVLTTFMPPAVSPAKAAIVAASGIEWLGHPDPAGAGWTATSAQSAAGFAAVSDGPGVLELEMSGPGYLLSDYAASNIAIFLDGVLQASRPARPGAALTVKAEDGSLRLSGAVSPQIWRENT